MPISLIQHDIRPAFVMTARQHKSQECHMFITNVWFCIPNMKVALLRLWLCNGPHAPFVLLCDHIYNKSM